MQSTKTQADSCVNTTAHTKTELASIFAQINEISGLAAEISTAAEEQQVVSADIRENVDSIKEHSEENLKLSYNVAKDAAGLVEGSRKVNDMLLTFKV